MTYRFAFVAWFTLLGLAAFFAGCSDDTDGHTGTGGTAGSAGTGGSAGSSGAGGDPNLADRQSLLMCAERSSCRTASAQRIEACCTGAIRDAECLLIALRDRVEGTYEIELDHTFTSGSYTDVHVFVITPSGNVERSVAFVDINELQGINTTTYRPAERCTPKPPSFFSECLQEVQNLTDAAWDCVFPGLVDDLPVDLPWFEDCVEQAPTCE